MDKQLNLVISTLLETYKPASIDNFTECKSLYDFQNDLRLKGEFDVQPSEIHTILSENGFVPVDGLYYLKPAL